ncbi:20517_t:CDS:2 [Cetraspora pellucida]|uniref:20517_t:CDS:1 n=1 Tax=Cetraspora pellucida TaxID=1433469 RepID=A0A9N9HXZ3_9GLOM|nr:20517_t:CDS:2 [Cetraspora pellucida]
MPSNFINFLLFALLIVSRRGLLVYAQDTDSGIVSLNDTSYGWFVCSKTSTSYMEYAIAVVPSSAIPNDQAGTTSLAHRPGSFSQFGILTFGTNYTGAHQFADPNSASFIYIANLSCADQPVPSCSPNSQTFNTSTVLCLAVSNPNGCETKFSYSISFTSGVKYPALAIFDSNPSSCPTTTTPSMTTTIIDGASYTGTGLSLSSNADIDLINDISGGHPI